MENCIYAAGLMDGEGTITLSRRNGGEFRSPIVSMSSTTYELVQFMKDSFGGCVSSHKTYKSHHKPSWVWKISGDSAINFLRSVSPHMKEPEKLRRSQLILTQYKAVTKRNGKYNTKDREAKFAFEALFFHPSTP